VTIVAISDTHNLADGVTIPDGDVLLHAGDLTMKGTSPELARAAHWLGMLRERFEAVVAIPGNHDFGAENDPGETRALFAARGITWLVDEAAEIGGLRIYGSPWQPWFYDWAFNFPRDDGGVAARETWARIPADTDVLITHGPPRGILDATLPRREHAGCPHLLEALASRPRIRAHLFGHIHEGYGTHRDAHRLYVNASVCDLNYAPVQPPIVFEVTAA
jgi:Icc-related predicted phosphoesterase